MKRDFRFYDYIFCRATLYKGLVNLCKFYDCLTVTTIFFVFENDSFQGDCFQEENVFQVHAETIQCLSSFDAKKCSNKRREATCNSCPCQTFSSSKKATLQPSCYEIRSCNNQALEEIAGLLGPKQVTFHSQDDKAKVALGLPAENKQVTVLIHMEYEVWLPDHNFTIAPMRRLTPSVIGAMEIKEKSYSREAVTYSGPTYVAIRSAKHSQSSVLYHLQDRKLIRSLDEFSGSFENESNVKPVMIVTVDGGPDENPKYMKTVECAIDYFLKYDLDAFFIATNAAGCSAFNRVERRMAPLSKEMADLILHHKHLVLTSTIKPLTKNLNLETLCM